MAKNRKPAPKGWRWVFTPSFFHKRAKRRLWAKDYGLEAWAFLVRA